MTRPVEKTVLRLASLTGFALCVLAALWGWRTGVLTSQERMEALVASCGPAGALLFTVFQAVPGSGAHSPRRPGVPCGGAAVRAGPGLRL